VTHWNGRTTLHFMTISIYDTDSVSFTVTTRYCQDICMLLRILETHSGK